MKYLKTAGLTLALGFTLVTTAQAANNESWCYKYDAEIVGGGSSTHNVCAYFTVVAPTICPKTNGWVPTNDELVASSCNHGK